MVDFDRDVLPPLVDLSSSGEDSDIAPPSIGERGLF